MILKILKHKTLTDTYGIFEGVEIFQCSIPWLFPITATKEDLVKYWTESNQLLESELELLLIQLEDYNLITISLNEL